MTSSRLIFRIAGIWGLLIVLPFYFLFDRIGREHPPAITHPEFFYGFLGVTVAWQLAFLTIATDPFRFRPIMLPAAVEKLGFVGTLVVLYAQGRMTPGQVALGVPDLALGVLFTIAFIRTGANSSSAG